MEKFTFTQFLSGWSQPAKDHKIGNNDLKNVRTAFKNYVFPAIGVCSNNLASKGFGDVCDKLTLKQFVEACVRCYAKELAQNSHMSEVLPHPKENLHGFVLFLFDRDFDAKIAANIVSEESKRNYRPPLGRALKWLVQQWWWQEICPDNMPEVTPVRFSRPRKANTRPTKEPYAVTKEELPEALLEQLKAYQQFRLDGGANMWRQLRRKKREVYKTEQDGELRGGRRLAKPKIEPISESTYQTEERMFRYFWGWYKNTENCDLQELKLELLLDLVLLEDYRDWQIETRQTSHSPIITLLTGSIGVAKFFSLEKTKRRNWSDISIIGDLNEFRSECIEEYRKEHEDNLKPRWANQLITHADLQRLLPYLRQQCAPYIGKHDKLTGKVIKGRKQSDARILWNYQAYLLVKYFTFLPNRQQEPVQYSVGKTLFREVDEHGHVRYFARNIRHKNQRHTRKPRNYPLPIVLTKDFDEWLQKYRPKAELAIKSRENWLIFWGHKPDALESLQQRLESAKQGRIPKSVKNPSKYIAGLQEKLSWVQNRIACYPIAKENFAEANSFFFTLGFRSAEEFGKPITSTNVWHIVTTAVSKASQAVLGKAIWTAPHSFRHIAEKLSSKGKHGRKKLSKMINHGEEMGRKYAEQISEEFEEFDDIVDDWWEQ